MAPACGGLKSIGHVVILIQENRSFDHYFGTYRGVRGFQDPAARPGVFAQPGYAPNGGVLNPWHLDSRANGACSNDISHGWGDQHRSWDGGAMDGFVREHMAANRVNGPLTMAYHKRSDLELYYALADAFTICDGYHCSVIGPTDPNRLYSVSGTIDPGGQNGGPLVETLGGSTRLQHFGRFTWTTMPEQLRAAGVSWKVYASPDGNYGDNVLAYVRAPARPADLRRERDGGGPACAHLQPGCVGPDRTVRHLGRKWRFLRPRRASRSPGGSGEYLTVGSLPPAAQGIRGPVGLGFRVPLLVVSPFSRGGLVCSDTFDHTSTLRFLETRFGVEVHNLSAWRRSVTGDLTSAFNFAAPADRSVPALPEASLLDPPRAGERLHRQGRGRARRHPSDRAGGDQPRASERRHPRSGGRVDHPPERSARLPTRRGLRAAGIRSGSACSGPQGLPVTGSGDRAGFAVSWGPNVPAQLASGRDG